MGKVKFDLVISEIKLLLNYFAKIISFNKTIQYRSCIILLKHFDPGRGFKC